MQPPTALCGILVTLRFARLTQLVGFFFLVWKLFEPTTAKFTILSPPISAHVLTRNNVTISLLAKIVMM